MLKINKYLKEIQGRIFYLFSSFVLTFLLFYTWNEDIFYILNCILPAAENLALPASSTEYTLSCRKFIYTDVTEAFYTSIVLSFGVSLYLVLPMAIYHLWSFLVPSFFMKERISLNKYIYLTLFLYLGASIGMIYCIYPVFWNFFINFETTEEFIKIYCEMRVSSYVYFILKLCFFVHILFQCPIAFMLLLKYKILNFVKLLESRRLIYFTLLLSIAFFTPPDFVTQLFISIFFYIFIEFLFLLGFIYLRYTPSDWQNQ